MQKSSPVDDHIDCAAQAGRLVARARTPDVPHAARRPNERPTAKKKIATDATVRSAAKCFSQRATREGVIEPCDPARATAAYGT